MSPDKPNLKLSPERIEEFRKILRGGWGIYGTIYDGPDGYLVGHRKLDVDAMTDDEIIEVATSIAEDRPMGKLKSGRRAPLKDLQ